MAAKERNIPGLPSDLGVEVPTELRQAHATVAAAVVRHHPVSRRVGSAVYDSSRGSLRLFLQGEDPPLPPEGFVPWSDLITVATADDYEARQVVAMAGMGETRVAFCQAGSHLFLSVFGEKWTYCLVGTPALDYLR